MAAMLRGPGPSQCILAKPCAHDAHNCAHFLLVPREMRRREGNRWVDPVTPDINQKVSKRCFDGQVSPLLQETSLWEEGPLLRNADGATSPLLALAQGRPHHALSRLLPSPCGRTLHPSC